jgi:hypothetical protein
MDDSTTTPAEQLQSPPEMPETLLPITTALEGINLPAMPFPEQLAALRELYMNGVNAILDACLDHMLLTGDKHAILEDCAQFLTYLLCVKYTEAAGQPLELRTLMQSYRQLHKRIDKEVPGMLHGFAAELRKAPA